MATAVCGAAVPRRGRGVLTPEVSVVVPTRNGMATLPSLAAALSQQTDAARRELVIVDSGSSDGTIEFARRVADRLVTIRPAEFNHGTTRNLGVGGARGALVVLLVQDARPVGGQWLSALLEPLRRDPRVAGAFARQVPRPDASAVVRRQLAGWVASAEAARTVALDRQGFAAQRPEQRLAACAFDNVCSAIRRRVWEQIPFRPTPIAEDLEWGRDVLLAGHHLAFAAGAAVEHSHARSAAYEFRRTWALHQQLQRIFGLRTIPTVAALAASLPGTLADHHRLALLDGHRIGTAGWRSAMRLGLAWPLGQFLGGWTAETGRHAWRPRGV